MMNSLLKPQQEKYMRRHLLKRDIGSKIVLSSEHNGFEWLTYDEAITRLTWDSNKTALYELNCRLLEACQSGRLEGETC